MIRIFAAALLLTAAGTAHADDAPAPKPPPVDKVSHTDLRVCADPANLPYSNDRQEGFENKIAQRIAQDLGETLSFTWFPDSQGFARATLFRHRCDVIIGTVEDAEDMRTPPPTTKAATSSSPAPPTTSPAPPSAIPHCKAHASASSPKHPPPICSCNTI